MPKSSVFIIGLGNAYRSDDAVGLIVARQLKKRALDCVKIIETCGDATTLMESWKNADAVILIDAVHSGAKPGTLHQLDAIRQAFPAQFLYCSTHVFGVAEVIGLARVLNQLPTHLVIYGIEGKNFTAGIGLSPEVERGARDVVEYVLRSVHALKCAS